jgi:hypothetical protein
MVGPALVGIQRRREISRRFLRAASACLSLLLVACASGPKVNVAPAGPVPAWGVAVYPVLFREPVSPFQSYVRGRAVAESLAETTGLLVYGPGEFRIDNPDDDDVARGTNLGELVGRGPRRLEGLHAVRIVVARSITEGESQRVEPAGGAGRRRRGEALIEVVVRAELLSAATKQPVAELEGLARVDPFADAVTKDPFPEVTALTELLTARLVKLAGWPPQASAGRGLKTMSLPAPAMAFSLGLNRSLAAEWGELDPLDRDGRWEGLLDLLAPGAGRAEKKLLKRAPHGLLVREAPAWAGFESVAPGELLVSADGEPLVGRQTLLRRLAAGRSRLTVRGREGDRVVDWVKPNR